MIIPYVQNRIYRITHVENLPLILEQGGLWCGKEMAERGLPYRTIGNNDLTQARRQIAGPVSAGGYLSDYVPFYFCPRSVMLYQIYKRHPATYGGGQEPIIHLISNVQTIQEHGCPFAFTDKHAYTETRQIYDDLVGLQEIDWETIKSRDWASRPNDPERQERKMAEFLVHRFVEWKCITGIAVFSQSYRDDVKEVLDKYGVATPCAIKQNWYY